MNHIDTTSDHSRRMTKNNKDKRNSAGDIQSPDMRPSGDTVGELGCFSSPETNPKPDRRARVSSNLINRECLVLIVVITRTLSMFSRVNFGDSPRMIS